jgi:hypothetical protein
VSGSSSAIAYNRVGWATGRGVAATAHASALAMQAASRPLSAGAVYANAHPLHHAPPMVYYAPSSIGTSGRDVQPWQVQYMQGAWC